MSDEVKQVIFGLNQKKSVSSGLTKAQLAVVVNEIKHELEYVKKRNDCTSHCAHLLNLIEYYKPIELGSKDKNFLNATNILINKQESSSGGLKSSLKQGIGLILKTPTFQIEKTPANQKNPSFTYLIAE